MNLSDMLRTNAKSTTPSWRNEALGNGGTLALVYEYKLNNATQYGIAPASASLTEEIRPGATSDQVYSFSLDALPSGALGVKYRLVYRGKVGQEEDGVETNNSIWSQA